MKNIWRWIIGIVAGLVIIGVLFTIRSNKQAYNVARGAIENRTALTQNKIDAVTQMAMTSVDLAVKLAGDLPSQQAQADLVKQDIQEISTRLSDAVNLKGQLAVDKLDQSIAQFDQTLQAVDQAAQTADTPAVKAIFDRIYGVLSATEEQLKQFILTAGQ
jgi:hypothetical protein